MKKFKNNILTGIKIEKIGAGGVGIATLPDGKKIIIKGGVLPGATINGRILRNKKDYYEVQMTDITDINESIMSNQQQCGHCLINLPGNQITENYQNGCGGCKWQILDYHQQLILKKQIIIDSFRNCPNIFSDITLPEIIPAPQIWSYRNKIEFSFGKYYKFDYSDENPKQAKKFAIKQDWCLGFHKQGDFTKVVDISNCLLISLQANKIFNYLKQMFYDSGLPVYDQKTQYGFLRHLVIREGVHTGQILINVVISDKLLISQELIRQQRDILKKSLLQDKYLQENISTFVITINNGLADVVKPEHAIIQILWGKGYIFETLNLQYQEEISLKFRISPFAFFQTNTLGAEILFHTVLNILLNKKYSTLLDLYCGTGTIGLSLLAAGICQKLIGIEIVEEAIIDAQFNAKLNQLDSKSTFYTGIAEKIIFQEELINILPQIDLIVVDPPRDGLHKNVIKFLTDLKKFQTITLIYISCNPVTMSRDINIFLNNGWQIKQFQPVDMFPHTHHIEAISLLI